MPGFAVLRAALTAICLSASFVMPAAESAAQDSAEDLLFGQLLTSTPEESLRIERKILELWSDSGSPSMNLLLQRGRQAMINRNFEAAIEHLTALTDHAPEFAEGWNARATAWYLMEQYELSVSDIAVTLELNGRHFGALSGLAMIMEKFGEDAAALRVYSEVQNIHPNRAGLAEAMSRLRRKLAAKSI